MPSQLICHAPSQTSVAGHAGVADAAGAVVMDAEPAGAGAFDEVQPETNTTMQRHTRRKDRTREFFINAFLQGMG